MNDYKFLKDLAERLMHIPVEHGTDQGDVDRLVDIANEYCDPDDTYGEDDEEDAAL